MGIARRHRTRDVASVWRSASFRRRRTDESSTMIVGTDGRIFFRTRRRVRVRRGNRARATSVPGTIPRRARRELAKGSVSDKGGGVRASRGSVRSAAKTTTTRARGYARRGKYPTFGWVSARRRRVVGVGVERFLVVGWESTQPFDSSRAAAVGALFVTRKKATEPCVLRDVHIVEGGSVEKRERERRETLLFALVQ